MYRVNRITRNDNAGRPPVGQRTLAALAALLLAVALNAAPVDAQPKSDPAGQKDKPKATSPIYLPDTNSVQLHSMDGPPTRVKPATAPPNSDS